MLGYNVQKRYTIGPTQIIAIKYRYANEQIKSNMINNVLNKMDPSTKARFVLKKLKMRTTMLLLSIPAP